MSWFLCLLTLTAVGCGDLLFDDIGPSFIDDRLPIIALHVEPPVDMMQVGSMELVEALPIEEGGTSTRPVPFRVVWFTRDTTVIALGPGPSAYHRTVTALSSGDASLYIGLRSVLGEIPYILIDTTLAIVVR